jgi:hypothetical protein
MQQHVPQQLQPPNYSSEMHGCRNPVAHADVPPYPALPHPLPPARPVDLDGVPRLRPPLDPLHRRGLDALLPISWATWNTASLFGSISSSAARAAAKMNLAKRLLRDNLVVFLQETRGTAGDLASLPHTHLHFGTFLNPDEETGSSRAGGIVTSIHKRIIDQVSIISEKYFAAGRCHGLRLAGALFDVLCINVHLNPQWTYLQQKALFTAISKFIKQHPSAILLLGGDWNFVHSDDRRFDTATSTETASSDPIAIVFESTFRELVELAQPNYTRANSLLAPTAALRTLSRIDRIYTNIPPADLHDLFIQVNTVGSLLDRGRPSDHVPVAARLARPIARDGPARLPNHIVTHPLFTKHLLSLDIDDLATLNINDSLAAVKEFFREAARLTRDELALHGHSIVKVQLAAVLAVTRAARSDDTSLLRKLVIAAPILLPFVDIDNHFITNPRGVADLLHDLMTKTIDEDIAALEAASLPQDRKKPKRDLLRHRQALWRPSRRRTYSMALIDTSNNPVTEPEAISNVLTAHWGPIFAAKEIDLDMAAPFIDQIQKVPADFSWSISHDMLDEAISRTGSSSPGPDGVPYGAWRTAPPCCRAPLRNLLDNLVDNSTDHDLPDEFNYSHMVFIPKGDEPNDQNVVARGAGDLRPLNLSNTDNKLIALAINGRLSALCQATVSEQQRGFVAGRHLEDNLFQLEASAIAMSATCTRTAASIFFDFTTAFPALAHAWIFFVLMTMGVPDGILKTIRKLYSQCLAFLLFGGANVGSLHICSGIKQGCPLSGSIFALAIDPLIRRILAASVLHTIRVTAFADDIAIVVANLFLQLPGIMSIFVLWGAATALKLNAAKTAILPLWPFDGAMIHRWLRHSVRDLSGCIVANFAKYLGILLGPGAAISQWDPVASKVLVRAADACFSGSGIMAKIRHFRLHGTTTVLFKAQFAPLDSAMRQAYRKAEQRLTGSPWMALPPDLLHALTALGLPAELPDIEILTTAAQLRVVASSTTFWNCLGEIGRAMASDEVLLHPPLTDWYERSMLFILRDNWMKHNSLPAIRLILHTKPRQLHQRLCYKHIAGESGLLRAHRVLMRRFMAHGFSETSAQSSFATLCSILLSSLPSCSKFALLRTVCNAWNTTSRYHQPVAGCLFGCPPPADDRLTHYIACPCIAAAASRLLGIDVALLRPSPLHSLFLLLLPPATRLKTMIFIDGVFFTYNSIKLGGGASATAVLASRVKDMTRRTARHV